MMLKTLNQVLRISIIMCTFAPAKVIIALANS